MARTSRASIAFSLVAIAAMLFLPQMRDMLALHDYWRHGVGAGPFFHLGLAFFALSGWYWSSTVLSARFRFSECGDKEPRTSAGENLPVDPIAFAWVPRILFLAIATGGFGATLWSAAWVDAGVIVVWAGVFCTVLVFRRRSGGNRCTRIAGSEGRAAGIAHWLTRTALCRTIVQFFRFAPVSGWLAVGLLVLAIGAFLFSAFGTFFPASQSWSFVVVETLGRLPGPAAFFVCAGLLMGPLSFLTFWSDSYRFAVPVGAITLRLKRPPVISALVVLIVVTSGFVSLHNVRVIEPRDMRVWPSQRASLDTEWTAWRKACAGGRLNPAPIVVAVSGGASRSALWGLRVLTEIDRDIGARPTGIFAISSVSGGSLGTAAYLAALAAERGNACTLDRLAYDPTQAARRDAFFRDAMADDAVGPVLAGLLWGDAARALLGLPANWARELVASLDSRFSGHPKQSLPVDTLMRGGDRADALEEAFERNWHRSYKAHGPFNHRVFPFTAPFLRLAYVRAGMPSGRVPIWIANGAYDQTGDRILTAPFLFDAETSRTFFGAKDALGLLRTDVPISTAIDNTARFPYLSPAGELAPVGTVQPEDDAQVVDGGYFENEGLETALELARWLKGKGADPIIVQITADAEVRVKRDGKGGDGEDRIPRCQGFADHPDGPARETRPLQLLAPVVGVYTARSGHSHVALRAAVREFCLPDHQRFFHFYLYEPKEGDPDVPKDIPLNWVLSPSTAAYIWRSELLLGGNASELKNLQAALRTID